MPIQIVTTDITHIPACAVVNAANGSCMGGGGVDGAIHRTGGPEILEACRRIRRELYPGGLPTGEAVATPAGRLSARWVIHTVGPIWGSCGDANRCDRLLSSAYRRSLQVAEELGCESIAFPALSTGAYGYPRDRAARIAYRTVEQYLRLHPKLTVIFVFHTDEDRKVFEQAIEDLSRE